MRKLPKPQTTQVIDNLQPCPHFTHPHLPFGRTASGGSRVWAQLLPGVRSRRSSGIPLSSFLIPFPGLDLSPLPLTPASPLQLFSFCLVSVVWQAEEPKQEKRPISCPAAEQEKKRAEWRPWGWQPSSPAPGLCITHPHPQAGAGAFRS